MAIVRPTDVEPAAPSPELLACMARLEARLGLLEATLGL